jgi:hypothetical protein
MGQRVRLALHTSLHLEQSYKTFNISNEQQFSHYVSHCLSLISLSNIFGQSTPHHYAHAVILSVIMLSVVIPNVTMFIIAILRVITLNIVMRNVVTLYVTNLSVVAPSF